MDIHAALITTLLALLPATGTQKPLHEPAGAFDVTWEVGTPLEGVAAAWHAPHPVLEMQSYFTADGPRVVPSAGRSWRFGLDFVALGREGAALVPVDCAEVVVAGARVEYRRENVVEWYVNGERGLEQGFTLHRPPHSSGHGPLQLELAVRGELRPAEATRARGLTFLDEDGRSALAYSGLMAWDATGRELDSHLSAEGSRVLLVVDDREARYPVVIDPIIATLEGNLDAFEESPAIGQLGTAVALDGDTGVAGAPFGEGFHFNSGNARVFVRNGSQWEEQARLIADDGTVREFGHACSISGDTIVVGAPIGPGATTGSAFVFVRTGSVWTLEAKLAASDGELNDLFGSSVHVDGNTAVIGAPGDGAAYVFVRSGAVWTEEAKLLASDGTGAESFGSAVVVSGDSALVGAWTDDTLGTSSGSAYVFTRSGSTWSEEAKLLADDGVADDEFGHAVSIRLDTALIGAPGADPTGGSEPGSGAAYVFQRSGTTWTQEAKLASSIPAHLNRFGSSTALGDDSAVIGEPDELFGGLAHAFTRTGAAWSHQAELLVPGMGNPDGQGQSVALSSAHAWVGVPRDDYTGLSAGKVIVHVLAGGSWSVEDELYMGENRVDDRFGSSVALEGNTALIGAPWDDGVEVDTGAAYVFVRTGVAWSQAAKLSASDGLADDEFGSVSLSGSTALIGAPESDDLGTGSGSVYVFSESAMIWTEIDELTASDGSAGDRFGHAMALTPDLALAGAPGRDDLGLDSGAVYVLERSGMAWLEQSKLTASDGGADDRFGSSVALSGTTAAISAPGAEAVYVFTDNGAGWTEQAKLARAGIGDNVAVHGDLLVAGAPAISGGIVYVFKRSGATWNEEAQLTDPSLPNLPLGVGRSVALHSEEVVLFGTSVASLCIGYVYTKSGTSWVERARFGASVPDEEHFNDRRTTLAIDGDTVIFGIPGHFENARSAGLAHAFRFSVPPPVTYCLSKTNTCGSGVIASTGIPSATATSGFLVTGTPPLGGRVGVLLYAEGSGPPGPWPPFGGLGGNGVLCVSLTAGLRHARGAASGGIPGLCGNGAEFGVDMNSYAAGGLGGFPQAFLRSAGATVHVQWWGRESFSSSFLTNALEYTVDF